MRIGLFDSGIGGLTVLNKLKQKYPLNDYIYYGDTINMPYGNKNIDQLNNLSGKCVEFLIKKQVDLIIIACGTISSNCYKYLKNRYKIEIIDILTNTIKKLENLENVYVIATEKTCQSNIFKNCIPCPNLVLFVEKNREIEFSLLDSYLGNKKIDYLVLGCTHYSLIKDKIQEYDKTIKLIDLADNVVLDENSGNGTVKLYFSKVDDYLLKNLNRIIDFKYTLNE